MIYHNNYENKDLRQIINTFSHYQQVSFALYCAKDVEHFANDARVIDCNQIVEQWLNGDQTVDLEFARDNAWNAYLTSVAAVAAVAYYASASYAAIAASYAASANAAYSIANATSASCAKAFHLHPNDIDITKRNVAINQFYQEYNQIAQNWLSLWEIPDFPKDEPDFPIFDYLQDFNLISSLLPKKEYFYYLNLNGFDIKQIDEMELLKLIDTTHIKNILRRIINNDLS